MSEAHCSKCGSVLPEAEEGLCPTCGTPFGAQTVALEVTADDLAAFVAERDAKRAAEEAAAAPPPPRDTERMPAAGGGDSTQIKLLVGIAFLVAALGTVAVWLAIR